MYEQQRNQILGTQFNVDSLAGAQEQARLLALTLVETYDHALTKPSTSTFGESAVRRCIEQFVSSLLNLKFEDI